MIDNTLTMSNYAAGPCANRHRTNGSTVNTNLNSLINTNVNTLSSSGGSHNGNTLVNTTTNTTLNNNINCCVSIRRTGLHSGVHNANIDMAHDKSGVVLGVPGGIAFSDDDTALGPTNTGALANITVILGRCPGATIGIVNCASDANNRSLGVHLSRRHTSSITDTLVARNISTDHVHARNLNPTGPVTDGDATRNGTRGHHMRVALDPLWSLSYRIVRGSPNVLRFSFVVFRTGIVTLSIGKRGRRTIHCPLRDLA